VSEQFAKSNRKDVATEAKSIP